jgi:hypothetical protein
MWASYLRTRITFNTSPLLGLAFLDVNLQLDSIFTGVAALPPRWLKCVDATAKGLPNLTNRQSCYMLCPYTAIYVSSDCYACVLILKYMRPHAAVCVCSYCYICVLICCR